MLRNTCGALAFPWSSEGETHYNEGGCETLITAQAKLYYLSSSLPTHLGLLKTGPYLAVLDALL